MAHFLAGLAEVAETLGVSKRTAVRYVARADFPEPLERLAAGPIWRRDQVAEWGRLNLPLQEGRPRSKGEAESKKPD